jgi:hypothetical protein
LFQFLNNADDGTNYLARPDVQSRMTDKQFIVSEINRFRRSKRFFAMIAGDNYYSGKHDILHKKRSFFENHLSSRAICSIIVPLLF